MAIGLQPCSAFDRAAELLLVICVKVPISIEGAQEVHIPVCYYRGVITMHSMVCHSKSVISPASQAVTKNSEVEQITGVCHSTCTRQRLQAQQAALLLTSSPQRQILTNQPIAVQISIHHTILLNVKTCHSRIATSPTSQAAT